MKAGPRSIASMIPADEVLAQMRPINPVAAASEVAPLIERQIP